MFAASKTASVSGGYQISRSLRFNSADSAYLNRTPASAGNRRTFTFSTWLKRSFVGTGADNSFFDSYVDNSNRCDFTFGGTGNAQIYLNNVVSGSLLTNIGTVAVFRDPSAWYHIVFSVDTTQATSTNRIAIYINGVAQTLTGTYPTLNEQLTFNYGIQHTIGAAGYNSGLLNYLGAYITEVNFIDGQALTPSSFGETNAQTGVWQPKAYSGSYGTNGFYLNFSDNSNTTAATLGKDYSGNGNNWTPNNFSVTAGAGNDSLVDSPTSYGTDTGAGGTVRGNYCTMNPLNKGALATLTNGNLDATATGTDVAYSTIGMSSGKWYWEVTCVSGNYMVGIGKEGGLYDYRVANGYGYFYFNGQKYNSNTGTSYGATFATGDVIGVGLDMDAGTLTFYKNGTSQGTAYSGLTGTWFANTQDGSGGGTAYNYNFGQRPFAYTAPSGYKALCTQNLPTPTIGATSTTLATSYFNPVIYTGNGTTQSVTGVGFQPDFVWVKERSSTSGNVLFDVIRGVTKYLESNVTAAEGTDASTLTAFNSDGFSVGSSGAMNQSSQTYVGWNWKANGSGSTNTAGTITSTVSANTTSGFSVVTFTATANSGSIGHGLGVAPSMIILKSRNNTSNWVCYHASLGADKYINLDSTAASVTNTATWQNTTPTSTVFYSNGPFVSGYTEVAYCFAEVAGYSKFGSFVGNGSSDGPFIFTGFRPAYVMYKGSSTSGGAWDIHDAARSPRNVAVQTLFANTSGAEGGIEIDILSNGFKIRDTSANANSSGVTYIYAAFAEAPQKFSLAR